MELCDGGRTGHVAPAAPLHAACIRDGGRGGGTKMCISHSHIPKYHWAHRLSELETTELQLSDSPQYRLKSPSIHNQIKFSILPAVSVYINHMFALKKEKENCEICQQMASGWLPLNQFDMFWHIGTLTDITFGKNIITFKYHSSGKGICWDGVHSKSHIN